MSFPENISVFIDALQNGFFDMVEMMIEGHEKPKSLINFVVPSLSDCDEEFSSEYDHLSPFEGLSPLLVAVETGDCEIVQLLLNHNADVSHSTPTVSALSIAIEMGSQDVFDLLLDHNTPLNWRDVGYGWSLLVLALVYNRPAMASALLDRGIDAHLPTSTGVSPIVCAARLQSWGMVERLLDKTPLLPTSPSCHALTAIPLGSRPNTNSTTRMPPKPDVSYAVEPSPSHHTLLQLMPCVHIPTVSSLLQHRFTALLACPRRCHLIASRSISALRDNKHESNPICCPYASHSPNSLTAPLLPHLLSPACPITTPATTCSCPPCLCPLPSLTTATAPSPAKDVPLTLAPAPGITDEEAAPVLGALRNVNVDGGLLRFDERLRRTVQTGYGYGAAAGEEEVVEAANEANAENIENMGNIGDAGGEDNDAERVSVCVSGNGDSQDTIAQSGHLTSSIGSDLSPCPQSNNVRSLCLDLEAIAGVPYVPQKDGSFNSDSFLSENSRGKTMLHHILSYCAPRVSDSDVSACLGMVLQYAKATIVVDTCPSGE